MPTGHDEQLWWHLWPWVSDLTDFNPFLPEGDPILPLFICKSYACTSVLRCSNEWSVTDGTSVPLIKSDEMLSAVAKGGLATCIRSQEPSGKRERLDPEDQCAADAFFMQKLFMCFLACYCNLKMRPILLYTSITLFHKNVRTWHGVGSSDSSKLVLAN